MSTPTTLAKLWSSLAPDVRVLVARSFLEHEGDGSASRMLAEVSIARALKARDVFVRRMPVEKKAAYLATAVRPDESLASSLLLTLHLEHRRPMLTAFLDDLAIPHENGLIAEGANLRAPAADRLEAAARGLYERFPEAEVTLYFRVLLMMDSDCWGGLGSCLGATPRSAP